MQKQRKIIPDLPDLTIDDIGSKWWKLMYKRTKDDCFNEKIYPPFPDDTRQMYYNENIYVLATENCIEDCNGKGLCTVGRCTCMNGYHGDACQYTNCPNSLVFVDIDTIQQQETMHCSQHGECDKETSTCLCNSTLPYFGPDCTYLACQNNCSNTENETVAECIQDYPMSYCRCFQNTKRGGNDCSKVYCLNECTGHGTCLDDGTCECEENFFGTDCSVFVAGIMGAIER